MSVALVTGGGRGIGAAVSQALAADGWTVCVAYRSDAAAARQVAERCGDSARAVRADVASDADISTLFDVIDDMGPLGALVNNAGIVAEAARVDEIDGDRIRRMFAVNFTGPFLCAGEAVRRMSTRNGGTGGVIVNISSLASRLGSPNQYVDYAASKAAVDTMTIGLAREVAAESVRVACVRPGLIDTEIHASGGQPGRVEALSRSIPMRRAGHATEVAAMVRWLCSDEASYVTGSVFDVGGGL